MRKSLNQIGDLRSMANTKVSEQDKKVQYVLSKYNISKDYYRVMRSKFTKWDEMYFNIPTPKREPHMSNLVVPATHRAISTLLARLVNFTTAVDPNFDVVPSNKQISNLIRSQLFQGGFYTQYVLFCTQLLVRGTSIGKVTWQKKVKKRFTLERLTENIKKQVENIDTGEMETIQEELFKGYKKKPTDKVKYDGPIFEAIDIFDFFPEPTARTIYEGARIFRSVITKDQYMRNSNFINKNLIDASDFPGEQDYQHSRLKSLGLSQPNYDTDKSSFTDPKHKKRTDMVELLECETQWFNKETGRLEPWLMVVANQTVLARDEAFPYWNTDSLYVKGEWIPVLNEFYGIGIPELTESLQEELNDKRNQRIDNVNQILMPVFMYEETAVDPKYFSRWKRKPGAKLRLRPGGINATKWDYAPDVTTTAMVESADLERNIEELSGAVKAIQPSSGGGDAIHRTSSGLMLLQNMAHEKIKLNLSTVEKNVLEPMWSKFYDLNLQFLSEGYKIFDADGKSETYSPAMLIGDPEFRAKGSKYALDQQMKLTNLSRVIESLGASGIPLGELHIKFWIRLYDAMGFEDKDEVEKTLRAEIQKQQQQQAALAQAQAQAKGGGGAGGGTQGAGDQIRDMTGQALGVDQVRSGAGSLIPGGQ